MSGPGSTQASLPIPFPNLPATWVVATVATVGTLRLGQQRSPSKTTGKFPTKYLRAANIQNGTLDLSDVLQMDFHPNDRERFALQVGDLLVSEASGSPSQVGRSAIWRGDIPECCYQNTVIRVRPHAAHPEFAHIVFRHFFESGVLAATARGVGIQHLGAARFSALPFPLPPWNEQQRISQDFAAHELDLLEALQRLRSARRRLKEQDDLTLQAASTGRLLDSPPRRDSPTAPDQPSLLVLPPDPKQSPHSAKSPLPDGWNWVSVAEAGRVRLGKQLTPQPRPRSALRKYLRVANVHENRIDPTDVKQMHFTDAEYDSFRLQPGDILLNEGQSPELVGRPALYRDEVPGACFQNALLRFRASPGVVPEYALLVFRHYLRSGIFRSVAKWSTNIAHLGLKRFAALPFPLPPLRLQRRIVTSAAQRLHDSEVQRQAVADSLLRLSQMQTELLRSAVSGELSPQDPADEPASSLLARLGPPPQATRLPTHPESTRKERRMAPTSNSIHRLAQVLREAKQPLSLPDLFTRAGYDPDSTEDVERFYLQLRSEYSRTLHPVGDTLENALLEVPDATP